MSTEESLVRILIGAVLCGAWVGCAERTDSVEQLQSFLQKERSPVCGVEYRVLPPDVLGISSRYVREIDNLTRKVRPDGKISLPLVGDVFVAGKTLPEIGYEIAWAARKYYQRVDVTVFMVDYNSQKVYVFGQVFRPGPLPWTGSDTLLDVLAQSQPTLLAWPEKIKVVRGTSPKRGGYLPGSEGGEQEEAKELTVDLMAMVTKGDMSHNILLWPDDVIYVPPNPTASVGLALRQLLFPVQPVLEAARVPTTVEDAADVFE